MCSEEDPDHCHGQHLISQTLLRLGISVLHIRGEGVIETAKMDADGHQAEDPAQMSLFPPK